MKTYADVFGSLDRAALIPFFVLGDPDESQGEGIIEAAVTAGADILELGIPFSDPIADGPTIQKADIRALEAGMTVDKALAMITRIKARHDVPVGLLMYYNLVWHYGVERFYAEAARAGVNSVLVADLCIDDAAEVEGAATEHGMDTVYMVTPNTPDSRRREIARRCTGFVYTVGHLGVTGARAQLGQAIGPLVHRLKADASAAVCVGFGVSQPEHAGALAEAGADGVIVGSALVGRIEEHLDDPQAAQQAIAQAIQGFRTALEQQSGNR